MVRKLGGDNDRFVGLVYDQGERGLTSHSFISFQTGQYKLHYYETLTSIKFVMLTDIGAPNMRNVLHQIYVNIYIEYGTADVPSTHTLCRSYLNSY